MSDFAVERSLGLINAPPMAAWPNPADFFLLSLELLPEHGGILEMHQGCRGLPI
jgi:hypothetical protein